MIFFPSFQLLLLHRSTEISTPCEILTQVLPKAGIPICGNHHKCLQWVNEKSSQEVDSSFVSCSVFTNNKEFFQKQHQLNTKNSAQWHSGHDSLKPQHCCYNDLCFILMDFFLAKVHTIQRLAHISHYKNLCSTFIGDNNKTCMPFNSKMRVTVWAFLLLQDKQRGRSSCAVSLVQKQVHFPKISYSYSVSKCTTLFRMQNTASLVDNIGNNGLLREKQKMGSSNRAHHIQLSFCFSKA